MVNNPETLFTPKREQLSEETSFCADKWETKVDVLYADLFNHEADLKSIFIVQLVFARVPIAIGVKSSLTTR
ncbi:MAG: hypothetical protein K8F24_12625 [Bacteroidales bacterium]|nr:hypothetical protein [Bacteroidales bacterium]